MPTRLTEFKLYKQDEHKWTFNSIRLFPFGFILLFSSSFAAFFVQLFTDKNDAFLWIQSCRWSCFAQMHYTTCILSVHIFISTRLVLSLSRIAQTTSHELPTFLENLNFLLAVFFFPHTKPSTASDEHEKIWRKTLINFGSVAFSRVCLCVLACVFLPIIRRRTHTILWRLHQHKTALWFYSGITKADRTNDGKCERVSLHVRSNDIASFRL